jgi:hypothetical protein
LCTCVLVYLSTNVIVRRGRFFAQLVVLYVSTLVNYIDRSQSWGKKVLTKLEEERGYEQGGAWEGGVLKDQRNMGIRVESFLTLLFWAGVS